MDERSAEIEEGRIEVYKHNRLIDARTHLSIHGLRVFALGVAKSRPGKVHDSRIVSFSTQDYSDLLESSSHSLHADLRAVARELVGARVSIPLDDNRQKPAKRREWLEATLVAAAKLNSGTGVFQMEFSEMLAPWIFDLHRNFCRYDLVHAMRLTSCYAFRFYELVKSWQGNVDEKGCHRPFTVRLDDLRKTLGIKKTEYLKYSHFRARVLDSSIKQMEQHTDISFSYKEIKKARAIVALELTLLPRTATQPSAPVVSTQPTAPVPEEQPYAPLPLLSLRDTIAQIRGTSNTGSETARVRRSADLVAEAEATVKRRNFAREYAEAKVKLLRFELDKARNADPLDAAICTKLETYLAEEERYIASWNALYPRPPAI